MTKKPWQRQAFVKTNVRSVLEQEKRGKEFYIIWLSWSGRYALIVVPMKRSMVSRLIGSVQSEEWGKIQLVTAILTETEQKTF